MSSPSRRQFIRSTAIGTGILGVLPLNVFSSGIPVDERPNVIGPREGFSPQVGTLLSMMTCE